MMLDATKIYSTIKVLPQKSNYRVCKVDANDLQILTSEGHEIISYETLFEKENPTSMVISDYEPGLYRKIIFKTPVVLTIEGSQEEAKQFRSAIINHLRSANPNLDLKTDKFEKQADQIIYFLATYRFDTFRKKYRAEVRRNVIEFYPEMLSFINAKTDVIDGDKIELNFGNRIQKNFKLPTPLGAQHMINALSEFFLDYYNLHKPIKTYATLTNELILANSKKISDGEISCDEKLIELSFLNFHFEILGLLKTFEQFPISQRPAPFNLTEVQGVFIVKVLHLIGFDSFRRASFQVISPNFTPILEKLIRPKVTELRLKMKDFKEHYSKQSFYTI